MLGELLLDLRVLELERTADNSRTELVLLTPGPDGRADLSVTDVQRLAGALLGWLVEQGHQLPELPALEDDLEPLEDEDEPEPERSRPPISVGQYGELVVETPAEGEARITRADPWVLCTLELWDELRASGNRWTRWDDATGLVTLHASSGASVQYRVRPDVRTPRGTVALEQTRPLLPAVHALPEHTRG